MAGGGSRRGAAGAEEMRIGSGNVFAALETLKKKKKPAAAGTKKQAAAAAADKPEVLWAPAPLTAKSWADVEDDDDDDYFATTAPPRPVWGTQDEDDAGREDDEEHPSLEQEIESEDDSIDDEVDAAAEDEHEHEAGDAVPSEPAVQKTVAAPALPKDTERQLSKKELKKKGLEELDAVLAELGISAESNNATQDGTNDVKGANQTADGEKKEDAPAPSESKTSKKKKAKKDKSSKEAKETQDQNVVDESAGAEPDEDASSVDVKERIKKVASMKKKKSSKEMDAAAKIAASEATARRAKLAAAKKKEKNHYNQQPVR